jgi:hypothetical protein
MGKKITLTEEFRYFTVHLYSLFVFVPTNALFFNIKKNEMGWACGAYGGGERCAQGVGGEA